MPSMSSLYAYLAPVMCSYENVRQHTNELPNKIRSLVDDCVRNGLIRGLHYTLKPLSQAEIEETTQALGYAFPARVPMVEIAFRNRKSFEVFRSSGLADELDEPI